MTTIAANNMTTETPTRKQPTPSSFNNTDDTVETAIHSKRRKVHDIDTTIPSNKSNTESRIRFLTVHFNVLQALYRDKCHTKCNSDHSDIVTGNYQSTTSNSNGEEGPTPALDVDTNIWDHIQSFMMYQRESLLQIHQQVEHMSNIHQAALEYCHTPSSATVVTDSINHSNNGTEVNLDHFTSNPKAVPLSSTHKPPTNDSFGIIANIIGYQSKVIQQQKQVPSLVTLQQLQEEVTKRIASLQLIYNKQCELLSFQSTLDLTTTAVPKQSPTIGAHRSYRTELQYKIHLWSLLAHDLREVLRN
jgi:hypothetical protein